MNNNIVDLVLIFGVTGDIGEKILKCFYDLNKYYIIGIGKNQDKIKKLQTIYTTNIKLLQCDIEQINNIDLLFKNIVFKKKKLKLVIIASGILEIKKLISTKKKDLSNILNINLLSIIFITKASIKKMSQNGDGKIFILGSRWGETGAANASVYSASKGGIRAFVKSMQKETINLNIRIMLISPGSIKSKMSTKVDKEITNKLIEPIEIGKLLIFIDNLPENIYFDEIFIKAFPYDLTN